MQTCKVMGAGPSRPALVPEGCPKTTNCSLIQRIPPGHLHFLSGTCKVAINFWKKLNNKASQQPKLSLLDFFDTLVQPVPSFFCCNGCSWGGHLYFAWLALVWKWGERRKKNDGQERKPIGQMVVSCIPLTGGSINYPRSVLVEHWRGERQAVKSSRSWAG